MAERPFQPAPTAAYRGPDPSEPLERAEGSALRDPVEQGAAAAAPRIATDAEPVRPTPDDALHELPPDLSQGATPLRYAAVAVIAILAALFAFALGSILFNQ